MLLQPIHCQPTFAGRSTSDRGGDLAAALPPPLRPTLSDPGGRLAGALPPRPASPASLGASPKKGSPKQGSSPTAAGAALGVNGAARSPPAFGTAASAEALLDGIR